MNLKTKILLVVSFIILISGIIGTVYCPWSAFLLPVAIAYPLYLGYKKFINKIKINIK